MTQGLYEQLGVSRGSTNEELLSAYISRASRIVERKRAISRRGGDYSKLEIDRDQLDRAYKILSNKNSRHRYDAMLQMMDSGWSADPLVIWNEVKGCLIDDSTATAAYLLSHMTNLNVPDLPPRHSFSPTPLATPNLTEVTANTTTDSTPEAPEAVVSAPDSTPTPSPSAIRIHPFDSSPETSPSFESMPGMDDTKDSFVAEPVINMPATSNPLIEGELRSLHPDEAQELWATFGPTGALLTAARNRLQISLEQVYNSTNIRVSYLEQLESEDLTGLPPRPFVQGYATDFAEMLGLPPRFAGEYTDRLY